MKKILLFLIAVLAVVGARMVISFAPRASEGLIDGYYTAECAGYYHGWKEFLTIYVNNGKVATVEYNARDASGFIKTWDMDYMRVMNATDENYPSRYTRNYAAEMLNKQDYSKIDAMSGATESFESFTLLAEAVVKRAMTGDKRVAFVEVTHETD
jgi:major membrane immunogen (membrane-anchored lipoprotein)